MPYAVRLELAQRFHGGCGGRNHRIVGEALGYRPNKGVAPLRLQNAPDLLGHDIAESFPVLSDDDEFAVQPVNEILDQRLDCDVRSRLTGGSDP